MKYWKQNQSKPIANALILIFFVALLAGCGYYVSVQRGDTLYSIAKENGVTVNDILESNPSIANPDVIQEGQKIRIPRSGKSISSTTTPRPTAKAVSRKKVPVKTKNARNSIKRRDLMKPAPTTPVPVPIEKNELKSSLFIWPCSGTIIRNYGKGPDGYINEGIDITSLTGTKISAAADGEVILVNTESASATSKDDRLKAWGNMVVIQHANMYVTVYAHNRVNLVKKGDKVKQGDAIGEVGDTGRAKQPHLHFEIRHNLESVNPAELLPR
jgi:murein DD-endopeptidase MepM/ murein hydrolase activator NlpD